MAWTAPRRWVTGDQITASLLNTYLRDNAQWLRDGLVEVFSTWPLGATVSGGAATTFTAFPTLGSQTLSVLGVATQLVTARFGARVFGPTVTNATCRIRFNLTAPAGHADATKFEVIADPGTASSYATVGIFAAWLLTGMTAPWTVTLGLDYVVTSGSYTIVNVCGHVRQTPLP